MYLYHFKFILWEDWGNYFAFQEKLWNSLFIFA
jgi:hypothetical protein